MWHELKRELKTRCNCDVACGLSTAFFPDSEEKYLFGRNFYPWKYFCIKDENTQAN